MSSEHNLLFGLLALQMEFVTRNQLLEATHAWVLEKQTPLGEILVRRAVLDADDRGGVEKLLSKHLRRHGGVQASLAALRVDPHLLDSLATLSGTDRPDSLAHSTVPPTDSCGPATVPPSAAALRAGPGAAPGRARYARLRPHAKGGLGEVSVALDEELGREVALKEIQERFADHPDSRARFVREAEITGHLEHPGVVPVYGLGAYADGRPYYAMRFIKGDSMHDAIEGFHEAERPRRDPGERSLALRELLTRFVAVCNAVAYAHSRGVIHRDLKPANVMLGKFGETLVVDWGLAKLLDQHDPQAAAPVALSDGGHGTATQVGQVVGTPAFMPPEQATGRLPEVGAASDVFYLGAILYAVLTGGAPYVGTTSAEMLAQAKLGEVVPARQRKPDVPRALEAVCARAMAASPKDRYSTAKELAEEVRRWLADEPVAAYREPFGDRARRWARRHRTLTTSAAAVLVAGVVALGAGLWAVNRERVKTGQAEQRERDRAIEAETNLERALKAERDANANLKLARGAVDETFGLVRDHPLLQRDHEVEVRHLLRKVLPYYESFRSQKPEDREMEAEQREYLARVAFITSEIGSKAEALKTFEEVRDRLLTLLKESPRDARYRAALAEIYNNVAVLQDGLSRPRDALENHSKALEIRLALSKDYPDDAEYQAELATTYNNLGIAQRGLGRTQEALKSYERARDLYAELHEKQPDLAQRRAQLGMASHNLGNLQSETDAVGEFIAACARVNVPEPSARAVAGLLKAQESYSFCKSHALAIAGVGWRQLALRVRCPVGFWAACLNHHEGRFEPWVYVEMAKRDGVLVLPPCANRSQSTWTQETTALRAGLSCVRGLSGGAVVALLEDRERAGPYGGFYDAKRRLSITPLDLQALSVAGAFDFAGKARQPCGGASWPVTGAAVGHSDRRAEWEVLGFSCGPPMVSLARRSLPADLADSRVLRTAEHGRKLRLAGLVAAADSSSLILLDEHGLFDVEVTPGVEQPDEAELVIAEGVVDVRHGAAVLKANKAAGWHPGVIPMPRKAGAA